MKIVFPVIRSDERDIPLRGFTNKRRLSPRLPYTDLSPRQGNHVQRSGLSEYWQHPP